MSDKECKIEGCCGKSSKKELCIKHYKRLRSHGEEGLAIVFHCSLCNDPISYRTYFSTKKCQSCYSKSYYKSNINKWTLSDKDRQLKNKYGREYYQSNRDKELAYDKTYNANPDNKKRRATRYRAYRKEREQRDPQFKLQRILRNRQNAALNGAYKVGSAVKDLGCTPTEFKEYLEKQFYPNPKTGEAMTWSNHTHGGWHIDHIKPLCSFDLTDRIQFLDAAHYTNQKPIWEFENLSKATKDKLCKKN